MSAGLILAFAAMVGFATELSADEHVAPCPRSSVTIHLENVEVKSALREIARQTKLNIAVPPRLRGKVTIRLQCAEPRTALREVVAQIGGSYCEEKNVIVIGRRQQPCSGTLHVPRAPQRAALR